MANQAWSIFHPATLLFLWLVEYHLWKMDEKMTETMDERKEQETRWVSPETLSVKGAMQTALGARPTVFDVVGGQPFFDELVDRFYDAVENDALLRPMYPANLQPSRERLAGFLAQYWGGPATYSERRGHPRLRMRHIPFQIGEAERDAWLKHMQTSLDCACLAGGSGTTLPAEIKVAMTRYFEDAANHLVNQPLV